MDVQKPEEAREAAVLIVVIVVLIIIERMLLLGRGDFLKEVVIRTRGGRLQRPVRVLPAHSEEMPDPIRLLAELLLIHARGDRPQRLLRVLPTRGNEVLDRLLVRWRWRPRRW